MNLRFLQLPYCSRAMDAHPNYIIASDPNWGMPRIFALQLFDVAAGDWVDVPVVRAETDRLDREMAGL